MTRQEQRLAIGLAAVLVVGGTFIAFNKLKDWKAQVDIQAQALDARRMEAETLLSQREFWQQRSNWLQESQPQFTKRSDADLELLKLIQESASKHNVKLTQNQLMPPEERPGLTSSTMIVAARGDMVAVLKWLHELQQPSAFISIPALTLTPNEEDSSEVDLSMNIQKWFRLPAA